MVFHKASQPRVIVTGVKKVEIISVARRMAKPGCISLRFSLNDGFCKKLTMMDGLRRAHSFLTEGELLKGNNPTLSGILHGDPGIRFQLSDRLC